MEIEAPSSPSSAVAQALAARRGKRTGVRVPDKGAVSVENGMENLNEFFDAAKTPIEKQDDDGVTQKKRAPKKAAPVHKPNVKPRFSLPGQGEEEEEIDETPTDKVAHILSRVSRNRNVSPGEMSRVSTAPPTPSSTLHESQNFEEDSPPPPSSASPIYEEVPYSPPEEVRAAQAEEREEAVASSFRMSDASAGAATLSPKPAEVDFPMTDDDDDDMLPPPPPEDQQTTDIDLPDAHDSAPDTSKDDVDFPNAFEDDGDDDDDKEGQGFNIVHDSETPKSVRNEKERAGKAMKKKKAPAKQPKGRHKEKDTASVATKSAMSTKNPKGRPKKVTMALSPLGYPVGNREYQVVPVSDLKKSPEDKAVRRSRRAKTKPLAFWKNERQVYGANKETGVLGEAMGNMPVVTAFITAQPTPYKKRKVVQAAPKSTKKSKTIKKKSGSDASIFEAVEETPFDSRKLRKKYNYIDGEETEVWDEISDDIKYQKIVSYSDQRTATDLPLPASRKKSEGKVVGKAAQAFNIPTDEDDMYVGYIMGNLVLPPSGIKDAESSGSCSLSFTVCAGQAKSIEVAFGDPHEEEGSLNSKTAKRFLLSPGDMFRVLPGNCYRLQNHSKSHEAMLSWTIIRPRRTSDE